MARLRHSISFSPSLPHLFWLLWYSLRHPRRYADQIPLSGSFTQGSLFFLTCLALGLVIRIILRVVSSRDPVVIFRGTTEGVITMFIGYFLYLLCTSVLFLLSKVVAGKASFRQISRALAFSSIGLIELWVPFLRLIMLFYLVYFLLVSLSSSNRYPLTMAIFTILAPSLGFSLILALLGLLDLNLLALVW